MRRFTRLPFLSVPAACALGSLLLVPFSASAQETEFQIVRNGTAQTQIVLPNNPSPVIEYAAKELQGHIKRASGATIPIIPLSFVTEAGHGSIYLNTRREMHQVDFDPRERPQNTFLVTRYREGLLIAGANSDGDPLDPATGAGTLFGVYHFLDKELGIRWAFPGESGTFVPERPDISVGEIKRFREPRGDPSKGSDAPWQRETLPHFWPSKEAAEEFHEKQAAFLRRQRVGMSKAPPVQGHILNYPCSPTTGRGREACTGCKTLTGQWATNGPTLYGAARAHAMPELSAPEILDEYYQAFGPAETAVREYFQHWEQADRVAKQGGTSGNRSLSPNQLVDDEVMNEGRRILSAAHTAAEGDEEAAQAVRYLQAGFDHVELMVNALRAYVRFEASEDEGDRRTLVAVVAALEEFREENSETLLADLGFLGRHEKQCLWGDVRDN